MNKAKIIVFLSTCACVDYYLKILSSYFQGNNCISGIHGKLKSKRRKRIID
jgi:superfamily II DNA/RNA helicase